MSRITVADMAAHIDALCAAHGIVLHERKASGGRASKADRRIEVRPVRSGVTYAIALHEIGHIVGPRRSGVRLAREAGAWEYAKRVALCWTPVMQDRLDRALVSYLRWSRRRRGVVLADGSHPIFALVSAEVRDLHTPDKD